MICAMNFRTLTLLALLVMLFACQERKKPLASIRQSLFEMQESDQKYRRYLGKVNRDTTFRDSLINAWNTTRNNLQGEIWKRQLAIDSTNLIEVEAIIRDYGYPGKSLVGEELSTAAWYVVQHAPMEKIEEYIDLIKTAGENNELPMRLVGMMEDRLLMYKGEPQIYGTQGKRITLKSGEQLWLIWPIENPDSVNQRREQAGFRETVEKSASYMNIEYKAYTIEEVRAMATDLN